MEERFSRFSAWLSQATGSPWATMSVLTVIAVWLLTGPLFHFSDTWQLIINTTTTIITNVMVFIVQNSQNRSDAATHVKLDEILLALRQADNRLIGMEERTEQEIATARRKIKRAARAEAQAHGQPKTTTQHTTGGTS